MVFAAIRIRGGINLKPNIKQTLQLLRLTRANHCVLIEENNINKGMLQVAKDYITWGEINKDVLSKLIILRGKLEGDKNITDDFINSATSYKNLEKISQAILDNEFKYKEISNVKPIFRLNPPKKGYLSIKRSYVNKGSLGYRGKDINKLLERMI
jgi:large subunit ribosomal protein L30